VKWINNKYYKNRTLNGKMRDVQKNRMHNNYKTTIELIELSKTQGIVRNGEILYHSLATMFNSNNRLKTLKMSLKTQTVMVKWIHDQVKFLLNKQMKTTFIPLYRHREKWIRCVSSTLKHHKGEKWKFMKTLILQDKETHILMATEINIKIL